jgi:hypothetical protein
MSGMIRIESTGCVFFSKVTNLEKILRQLSTTKHRSTSSLPSDTFSTNLSSKLLASFYHRHTNVFGWPAADTHIFRVSSITKLAMGKNFDLLEQKL